MMKKITVLLFVLYVSNIFSQTGIIKYTTKVVDNKSNVSERIKRMIIEANRTKYTLIYNLEKSYFQKDKNIPIYPLEAKLASVLVRSNKNSHQLNNLKKENFFNTFIKNTNYIVDDSDKMSNWVFVNETKIIDGYICFKATKEIFYKRTNVKSNNIAWYTPDIPVPYGPAGYGGLPGLILQLEIGTKVTYLVSKVILNPTKKVEIPTLKEGEKINLEEMVFLMQEARKVTKD
ncbi:GLPGLI family protein [Polaribacter sp. KT 15]|nr:GLPGLI family protein [Polaribacter sp. KT 15]SHN04298.1 GLPGLI family protein [Polaribacter sp. KT 15]